MWLREQASGGGMGVPGIQAKDVKKINRATSGSEDPARRAKKFFSLAIVP